MFLAFSKVALEAGETATVSFNLGFDAFAFYDIGLAEWVVEAGQFELQIGSSSRDIRLTATVDFATGIEASQLAQESYPPVRENGTLTAPVDDEIFAKRFGLDASETLRKIRMENDVSSAKDSRFDRNSLLKEVAASSMIGCLLRYGKSIKLNSVASFPCSYSSYGSRPQCCPVLPPAQNV